MSYIGLALGKGSWKQVLTDVKRILTVGGRVEVSIVISEFRRRDNLIRTCCSSSMRPQSSPLMNHLSSDSQTEAKTQVVCSKHNSDICSFREAFCSQTLTSARASGDVLLTAYSNILATQAPLPHSTYCYLLMKTTMATSMSGRCAPRKALATSESSMMCVVHISMALAFNMSV